MSIDFDDYDSYAPLDADPPVAARRPPGRAWVHGLAVTIGAMASLGVTAIVLRGATVLS